MKKGHQSYQTLMAFFKGYKNPLVNYLHHIRFQA